jgi:hypothetical protein
MTKYKTIPLLIALGILIISSLACSINLGGPKIPTEQPKPIPGPTTNPEGLLQTAIPEAGKGQIALELTDAQLTEYLKEQLKSQADPILQDPRVVLKDGEIEIYGYAQRGVFSGNVLVIGTVTVDDKGQPKLKITSANIGAVPIPSPLLDIFSNTLDEMLVTKLGSLSNNFLLEDIQITDGLMTVKGQLK